VLLQETISADRFFLSPRIRMLKRILDKLEPSPPAPERYRHRSRQASGAWR
jgi:hypothetical protein